MAGNILELTNENFESECLNSDLPVFVDFWAEWCGPCKMVAPTVAELAEDYDGKLKVCKVNVDDAREVAAKYGIRSIPTMMLFKDGAVKGSVVGAQGKDALAAFIDKNT